MNKIYLKLAGVGAAVGAVFSAVAANASSLFTIPTNLAASTTATVSDTIGDPGLLTVIVVAIALPLVFWLAHGLKGLFTRGKKTS